MAETRFREFQAEDITDAMLADAAQLFSDHYGIWGTAPSGHHGGRGKPGITRSISVLPSPVELEQITLLTAGPGNRVKMSASRLRAQCLPTGAQSSYVSVT